MRSPLIPAPPPTLYEREAEMDAIAAAVEGARAGSGRLVVVEGPAGSGKSALLAAAARAALASGVALLGTQAYEHEREVPFGLALELLRPLLPNGADDSGCFRRLAALGNLDGGESAVVHALYAALLDRLAGRGPVLLGIDDLHRTDAASLRVLASVADRAEYLPLVVVVTLPANGGRNDPPGIRRLRCQGRARVLQLTALSPAGVTRMVREQFTPDAGGEWCAAIHAASRGNPFLVTELARELDNGAPPTPTVEEPGFGVPGAVARGIADRLGRLSARAQEMAEAVAVLGEDATFRRTARLAGLDEPAASGAIDELVAADLLEYTEPLRLHSPLAQRAVHEGMPPGRQAEAHRRAFMLLAGQGVPERGARHLLAVPPGVPDGAAECLRAAAEEATKAGRPDDAVRYLRRALEETPRSDQPGVLIDLAGVEEAMGDPAAIAHLREALDHPAAEVEPAELLLHLGQAHMSAGHFRAAGSAFSEGLDRLSEPDSGLARRLLAGQLSAGRSVPGQRQEALAVAGDIDGPLDGATPENRILMAEIAFEHVLAGDHRDEGIALARIALAGGVDGLAFNQAVGVLTASDELPEAVAALDAAIATAERAGSTVEQSTALLRRGRARYLEGDIQAALGDGCASVQRSRPGSACCLPSAHTLIALCRLEQGELVEARDALRQAEPGGRGEAHPLVEATRQWALGEVDLEAGTPKDALARFLAAGRIMTDDLQCPNPAVLPWRSSAAAALLATGERHEARRLAAWEVKLARRFGAVRPIGAGMRMLGLTEGGDGGVARLREAAQILRRSPARLERARVTGDLGAAMRRAGHRVDARRVLRDAIDLAAGCGSTRLTERLRQELKAAGGRQRREAVTGRDSLTPGELRVAELAASGLTNQLVAQRLFVTVKTVEWHLNNAFAKLGISSRHDLPAALNAGHPGRSVGLEAGEARSA